MGSALTFLSTASHANTCQIASGSSATSWFRTSDLPTRCSGCDRAGDDSATRCSYLRSIKPFRRQSRFRPVPPTQAEKMAWPALAPTR
jgi:hypothetical protein